MVGGAVATIISLMLLAWSREIVGGIARIVGARDASESKTTAQATIIFAVLMIYVLDFSINCIQAGIRAFIVDCAPTHQQDTANAWASRMTGVGNIIGYMFGYVDLSKYLWFFGDTQFKVLCVIASLAMTTTLGISCASIKERDPRRDDEFEVTETGVFAFFKGLFHSIQKLPLQISRICQVQFFAWIGWFPFLFYITTYIGEIYVQPYLEAHPNATPEELDIVYERGTRTGTFALLIFALATFTSSVFLPFIVAKATTPKATNHKPQSHPSPQSPPPPVRQNHQNRHEHLGRLRRL
jgi:solute carrier family 45 protein 1/2/4